MFLYFLDHDSLYNISKWHIREESIQMMDAVWYGITMTLIGMIVVFVGLFILVALVWLMSIFCSGYEQRKKEQQMLKK